MKIELTTPYHPTWQLALTSGANKDTCIRIILINSNNPRLESVFDVTRLSRSQAKSLFVMSSPLQKKSVGDARCASQYAFLFY